MAANLIEFILKARDEATGKIKGVANQIGGIAGTAGRLGASLGVMGALTAGATTAGAALIALGKQYVETIETMSRKSAALGISTDTLLLFQESFKRFGLAPEAAASAMMRLNRAIANGHPVVRQLQLDTSSVDKAFTDLMGRLAATEDKTKANAIAVTLLGKGAGELAGIAGEWNSTIEDTNRLLVENNGYIGDSEGGVADLDKRLEEMDIAWTAATRNLQKDAIPAALEVLRVVSDLVVVITALAKITVAAIKVVIRFIESGPPWLVKFLKLFFEPITNLANIWTVTVKFAKDDPDKVVDALNRVGAGGPALLPGTTSIVEIVPAIEGIGVSARRPKPKGADGVELKGTYTKDPETGMDIFIPAEDEDEKERIRLAEQRNETIAEYIKYLGLARPEAVALYETEKAREELAKEMALREQLGVPLPGQKDYTVPEASEDEAKAVELATIKNISYEAALAKVLEKKKKLKEQTDKETIEDYFGAAPETIKSISEEYGKFINESLEGTAIFKETLYDLGSTLQSGLAQAFNSFLFQGQNFAEAMVGVMKSMVQAIIAELAKLAALKIMKAILTGGFGIALGPTPTASVRATNAQPPMVVYINAMDSRDVYDSLTSPRGSLRAAFSRAPSYAGGM